MSELKRGWANPHPVVVVSGTSDYLRWRSLSLGIREARKAGRRVVTIQAGDSASLVETLQGSFLFSGSSFVIVESANVKKKREADSWSEDDLAMILEHHAEGDNDVCLIVHHAGEVGSSNFAGKVLEGLPKGRHAEYLLPKPWAMKEYAEKFYSAEVRRLGKTIPENLVSAVIRSVGTDLGILSFEALKLSVLLDSENRTEIRREDLTGLIASFGAEHWDHLTEALATCNTKAIIRVLGEIRSGPSGDALIRVCVQVSNLLLRWIHTAELLSQGVGEEESAQRVGVHLFRHQKENLPPAKLWGRVKLIETLHQVVAVERGVKSGHQAPWIELESALILATGAGTIAIR